MESNVRTMEYLGFDFWSRPTYKCVETGQLWKDINCGDGPSPALYSCGNDLEGEPDSPIKQSLEVRFLSQPLPNEMRFNYQMLDRLRTDCEYFLGFGNGNASVLRYGNVQEHIAEMKKLHEGFPQDGKPEWLTFEQIEAYEQQMKDKSQ